MNSNLPPNTLPASENKQETIPLSSGVLKLILDRLNIPVEVGALINSIKLVEHENNNKNLVQRLGSIIYKLQLDGVQAMQLHWSHFDQRRLPALIWFNQAWYLVEREQQQLKLTDELGNSQFQDDQALHNSIVIWLRTPHTQANAAEGVNQGNQAAKLVWRELFKTKSWIRDVVIATLLINLFAVVTSIYAMQVYDRVVPTLAYATLWTLVTGVFIVVILDWCLKMIRGRILDSLACSVDRTLSQQVFEHVLHLRLDTRPRSLGSLAAQVGGLESVRQFFSSAIIFALVDMPFALFFITFIAMIGGSIAWVYLALLPVALILGWITQLRLQRLTQEQMIRNNERQGLLVDVIRGCESIRASGASWRFAEQWRDITHSISRFTIQQKLIKNHTTNTVASLSTCAYVMALVVGVSQIESGNVSMGALIACSILGGRVITPVARSVQYLSQWQSVSQALKMVDQVLSLDNERSPQQNLLVPDNAPKKIVLDGVRFSYPDAPILKLNIPKLTLNAGDRILVVGPIGSGKSTLLKMLAGLYRPSEGRVILGDADLWETDPSFVSDQVGYLPQSVHLFKGSLRTNLALSGAVSDSQLLNTCQELGIDNIASDNPRGMDLPISEGGEGLSGGQKQIVGLGRVFLAQPNIWLLDEPTASLDIDSDQKVLDAINRRVKKDDILIISTHRTAIAAKMANRIIVMQQGQIVDDGKPQQVLAKLMTQRSTPHAKEQTSPNTPPIATVRGGSPIV
ncbi:MAG: ATP-binding cassette domain-containing protein [Paraglaciecola sp.]|uniref:ATP-binding cassette domain-containing protein n=2 Tax=Paraglaciecola sp. TaxID=1920173 RepID=UPI0032672B4A